LAAEQGNLRGRETGGSTAIFVRRCEALLLDLDGVLVDSRAVVERTWRRWAQEHGLDAGPLLEAAHGRRTRDTLKAVAPGVEIEREVRWLDAAELEDLDGLVAVAGAVELVLALPQHAWAVVTSCGLELARRRLARAGVPAPATLVTSEDVPRGKPAPDGYRLAAKRLGRAPASCVAVEDAPPGIAAAREAGATVVALATTHAAEVLADADVVIPDLRSLRLRTEAGGLIVEIG
jgi:sugar-phosphatase